MRLLIADDNEFYCRMLKATLAEWGYEAVVAGDGHAAWKVLQAPDAPRLALIDWMMPGMDGLELCRRVRAMERAEPTYLILLTAREGRENIITGLRNGADDYICKPFDREELQARLQAGLRIVSLQGRLAARVGELESALTVSQKLEVMGRLAGGVAHDFNNLLTVILGGCQLLARANQGGEFVQMIEGAAERGATLTRQLLAFSRKQVLTPTAVQVNELVQDLGVILRRLIGEPVTLTLRLDPDLGHVKADRGQLEQVLMNLAVNARDAMPSGGELVIETRNVEGGEAAAGPQVLLRVADTGCGMDESVRARVFEPFFTTKAAGQGTGLGLSTVYGIVKQSHGHIRVESQPGRGSVFTIHLPRTDEEPPRPEADGIKPGKPGNREAILLVEDDDTVRSLARCVLQGNNYVVLEARDGLEGLSVIERWPGTVGLVLTDVVMPGLNGHRMAERLRETRPDVPVLYMSGYAGDPDRREAVLGEREFFLQKPFTPDQLIASVREALEARFDLQAAR